LRDFFGFLLAFCDPPCSPADQWTTTLWGETWKRRLPLQDDECGRIRAADENGGGW
jgi:hypothetical protein